MQAPGPGPRKAQFLKGWFVYRYKQQLRRGRLSAPYAEKPVKKLVFKSRYHREERKRQDQQQAEYPKGANPVSGSLKRVDVHANELFLAKGEFQRLCNTEDSKLFRTRLLDRQTQT
jgi:hypothetical protein